MHFRFLLILALYGGLSPTLPGQDGGQLYSLYCAACHGDDGKGATGGAFPPLAGSPWINGPADRSIKIVLHGLSGPVKVLGKTYNLEMPPQGAVIPDDQLAAVLTYVRKSWGNQAGAVRTQQVARIRKATAGRDKPWTADELLKRHPLEEKPPLANLISSVFTGAWTSVPDFSKLKPDAVEEEHDGRVALGRLNRKSGFGVVWEGNLEIPETGEYDFQLATDDGGRLLIDGEPLIEITGTGPSLPRAKLATIRLERGSRHLRIEYYQLEGEQDIQLGWRVSGKNFWKWLSEDKSDSGKTWPDIMLHPSAGRPVIYRNFIADTTPRAIGVGFPGGINMAYSGDNLAPELIWTGKFIDAGRHWTDRGIGDEPPAGENAFKPTVGPVFPQGASARGYELDPSGNPTFTTSVDGLEILDSYASSPPGILVRVIKVGGESSAPHQMTVASGIPIAAAAKGVHDLGDRVSVSAEGARLIDSSTLVLPLIPGTSTEIRYTWR